MTENYLTQLKKNLHENVGASVFIAVSLAFFVTWLTLYLKTGKKKYKLPPGPTGVPIFGYVPFLGEESYKELHRLKEIYGNVFSLYLGQTYAVILGDIDAVKDAFSKTTTLDRPTRLFDFIPDAVGFSSVNGEEWVEQRKFCVKSMKEHGIGQRKWESMIQMEVYEFIKVVSSYNGQPLDISKVLTSSVSNNILAFVLGKQLPLNHPDRMLLDKELDEIMQHLSQSSIFNVFTIVRDIAIVLGIGPLAKAHERMIAFNSFFRKEVGKLKECYEKGEHNFVVDYLTEMDNRKGKTGHYFNGGSDTTRTSINWLIIIMANYPDIQAKVQREIDSVLDTDGQIQWSDRKKLPYTFATIMEGQRWRTLAPLNTQRIATEDIKIQNYDIPKGTVITANNWGVHNDTKYWKEPEKFNPERFLREDGKEVMSKPESYVPFSYGKRNCPGEAVAMIEILIYFTALMQKFTILVPKGMKVNLNGKLGLTYQPYPQKFLFIPREHGKVALDIASS